MVATPKPAPTAASGTGWLRITTQSWAYIDIDGQRYNDGRFAIYGKVVPKGMSPGDVSVRAGRHRIEFSRSGPLCPPIDVSVPAGGTLEYDFDVAIAKGRARSYAGPPR